MKLILRKVVIYVGVDGIVLFDRINLGFNSEMNLEFFILFMLMNDLCVVE